MGTLSTIPLRICLNIVSFGWHGECSLGIRRCSFICYCFWMNPSFDHTFVNCRESPAWWDCVNEPWTVCPACPLHAPQQSCLHLPSAQSCQPQSQHVGPDQDLLTTVIHCSMCFHINTQKTRCLLKTPFVKQLGMEKSMLLCLLATRHRPAKHICCWQAAAGNNGQGRKCKRTCSTWSQRIPVHKNAVSMSHKGCIWTVGLRFIQSTAWGLRALGLSLHKGITFFFP